MAFVTTKSSSMADRIAGGLKQVGSALGNIEQRQINERNFQLEREKAAQNAKYMEAQMQQMESVRQERMLQLNQIADDKISDISSQIMLSQDPKGAFQLMKPRLLPFLQVKGGVPDDDSLVNEYVNGATLLKGPLDVYRKNINVLRNTNSSPEALAKSDQALSEAVSQMNSISPKIAESYKRSYDLAAENARKYQEQRTLKLLELQNKPEKESEFSRVTDRKQADRYSAAVDALPQAQQSINNLDNALKIMDRVFTGPLAGKTYAFGLQKLAKDDAQELELYLSKENIMKVMEFARSAGVRSIDTEQEQARLLKSIANKEQSPKVLRKALTQMKALQEEAIMLTQEKQAYVQQHGNLKGYTPSTIKSSPSKSGGPVTIGGIEIKVK